jgi:choline dehydrogenase-like flavoprotein
VSIVPGASVTADHEVRADVAVIGTGAGGAVLAARLAQRGLKVVVLEEGGAFTRADWKAGEERVSLPMLYQERGSRATADQAITVLQGRNLGGGTTVNWTTCFRTPSRILAHWRDVHRIDGWDDTTLEPHFVAVEERLGIAAWDAARVNANNGTLARGIAKMQGTTEVLRRNVRGCADSGFCGLGCPYDAKQAMHLTYLPDATAAGAVIHVDVRVERIEVQGRRAVAVHGVVMERERDRPAGPRLTVRADRVAVCGGALNSPALLLASGLDRPPVGRRTFLHPVVAVAGTYERPIRGWQGAPQSIASHDDVDRGPDRIGFFLEAAPLHPMLGALAARLAGPDSSAFMRRLPFVATHISLAVDGILDGDDGGTVTLRRDGRLRLDYPFRPALVEAMVAGTERLIRANLVAGAESVRTLHVEPAVVRSARDLKKALNRPYGALEHAVFSAHQMGGCAMGPDPATSVVRTDLRHHDVDNLWVVDGSVLPTALGVNPSETIYALAHRAADWVAG